MFTNICALLTAGLRGVVGMPRGEASVVRVPVLGADVSEVMNVIRMIKLFGWEPKVNDQLTEKRNDEMIWYRKYRLLDLANGTVK